MKQDTSALLHTVIKMLDHGLQDCTLLIASIRNEDSNNAAHQVPNHRRHDSDLGKLIVDINILLSVTSPLTVIEDFEAFEPSLELRS